MTRVTDPHEHDTEDERLRPLEERLRRLNWPQPPPEVRERTLEELQRKLAEMSSNGDGAAVNGGDPAGGDGEDPEEHEPSRQGPA
jgi:hypothetical protein